MIDLTSAFQGITTPIPELTNQIYNLGWELGKVSFGQGTYRATATNPHGEKVERTGLTDKTAVANVLLAIIRKHKVRNAAQHYGGMWAASWTDKLPQIAEAYSKAPVYDPKAASAWKELAQDSVARHRVLEQHLTIKVVPEGEPYASAKEMADDIHKNQNFLVSNAHCEHPVWTVDENVSFRVVHDVMGHAVSGGDFGWLGENLACAAHFPLLSETAQQALFVECIMQTGYAAYYRSFGPQKVFLPDEEMFLNTQREQNPENHTGIHPSQSFAPTSMPELPASPTPEGIMDKGFLAPHMEGSPVPGTFAKLAITMRDPNHGWESGHAPQHGMNAFTDMSVETPDGRTTDPLDSQAVSDNAAKIDTGWSQWMHEDGTPNREKMRQAIVNAFRVVLLSPRKDLRWNCHDDQTEVLTDQGWWNVDQAKAAWDTNESFRVATYTNGNLSYEYPLDMAYQSYRGEMIKFSNRYVDALVTPNHRMLTEDGLVDANKIPISLGVGRDTKGRGYGPYMPTGGITSFEDTKHFEIPGALKREFVTSGSQFEARQTTASATHFKSRHSDLKLDMDHWLEWLGWYVSEGWLDGRNHPWICQKQEESESPRHASIQAWGVEGSVRNNGMWTAKVPKAYAKTVGQWVLENVGKGARDKRLPEFAFTLSSRQAEILLKSMLDGDGTRLNENNWIYYTANVALANDIHRLATQLGYRAIIAPTAKDQFVVRINPGKPTRIPHPDNEFYDGHVWCFTTPAGTLITRRNGKTLISGNSVHYQDISHIAGNELDPAKYWDALEKSRQEWNVKHRGESQRFAHLPFKKLLPKLNGVIFAHHPHLTMEQIHAKTNELIYEWRVEEEHQVMQTDEGKSEDKQKTANEVENKVNKGVEKRIKHFIDDSVPTMDITAADQMGFDMDVPIVEKKAPQQEEKYGAFMGTHLNAIAQVSEHSDAVLDSALEDVKEHDGAGHHFRTSVLQLGISGVGPKVCSFAWLLLQPMTSQLGTIDTHMMDVLGHNYEKEMSTRDYFCFTPENLVRAERGWTPISEISTDDRVLTNSGIFEKVEKIMVREYQGPLVEAKTAVGVAPIRMTPEHPVLKLSNPHKRSDHKNVCSPHKCRATEHLHELTWDNADSLGGNSYIVSRTIDESQLEDVKSIEIGGRTIPLTDDFLWIIGLYLAEGSTSDRVVQFSLNKTETVYQSRVIAFFQKELNLRVHYAPSREGWNGVQLLIYDARLARAFSTTFGRGSKNKSIPAGILNLPTNRLGHVFDGIHSGDGCDSTRTLGQTSPTLALQVTEYLLRNGEMPSNSTWDDGDPNHSLAYITKYARPKVHKNKRGFWNLDGEKLVQTTITPSEYRGYVYNLEVAGDHTYVVQNVVVHNCFERELQTGRDASGYGHVPLGQFQWGMWDYKRTGPGTHQDHSAMSVMDPTDHNHIDWKAKMDAPQTAKADWIKQAPWWWRQTEEARKQTSEQFNNEVATPQNKVPFQVESMSKSAESKDPTLPIPWMADGQDVRTGIPGQTYAQFLRSTGTPAHSYWTIPDHALGRYHPKGGFVEVANGKIDQGTYDHIVEVLSPYNQVPSAA